MEQPNLDELSRRPARYWTIDGLPELILGLMWVIWGGAWLIGERVPHDWRSVAYWLTVPPVLALSGVAANWITRRLKERITFPRAGYVQWKEPGRGATLALGAAIVLAAAVLAAVVLTRDGGSLERTVPAVLSVILALGFIAVGIRRRTPYHFALGGAVIVLTLAIGTMTTGWNAMNWLLVALGAVCAVVGAVRLARFLRAHPLSAAEGL